MTTGKVAEAAPLRRPAHLRVILHEATRTGSPIVILELLRQLKSRLPVKLSFHFDALGPLASEFEALGDVGFEGPPSAILVNSALAAEAATSYPDVPAMLYVHEDAAVFPLLPPAAISAMTARFEMLACVSPEAAADLAGLGVEAQRITVIPPVVVEGPPVSSADRTSARASLRSAPGEVLVVGCGEASWRKGADHFVALARALSPRKDLKFGWIGLRPRAFARQLDLDVATLHLDDRVTWLGEVDNTRPFLAAADVLVVLSRYDPQPLVPIEAALVGTPSVGFSVGGLAALSAKGAALTAPYPDIAAVASLVQQVVADRSLRRSTVAAAVSHWRARQAPQVTGQHFVQMVARLLRLDETPTDAHRTDGVWLEHGAPA